MSQSHWNIKVQPTSYLANLRKLQTIRCRRHLCGLCQQAQTETLTCTHSGLVPRSVSRVVTVQPLVRVTHIHFSADVPRLLGTGFAAPAAIPHQAHSGRAAGPRSWALAWPVTKLLPLMHLDCFSRCASKCHVCWPNTLGPAAGLHVIKKKKARLEWILE